MTIRVLVLSDLWLPFPGGAERLMWNLARDLWCHPTEFDVRVVTGYEHAENPEDGPEVRRMPIGDGEGDPGWDVVAAQIAEHQPDVILTHHHYARLFSGQLAAAGIPWVQVVLNGYRDPTAAGALYISEFVRAGNGYAHERDGLDMVMTPPADLGVVAATHGDAIGFVKPIPHKGVSLVYEIARRMPDHRFVVLRGEWQTLEILPPPSVRNVELIGPVADMREFWERVRVVLMPSRSEDAGTVPQEAAINRVPCISTPVGGLVETNRGGVFLDGSKILPWVREIRWLLADAGYYERVVERQIAAHEAYDHRGRLARFRRMVAEIAGG